MKKRSDLSRLMEYAGGHRVFTYVSWVLSALSALVALVPFLYIWMILRDVLNAAPDYFRAVNIPHYGWMAVLFRSILPGCRWALRSATAAASSARSFRRAPARRRPILPISCRISMPPWQRRSAC